VQALAQLHAGGIGWRAHQIAAVVHVDVKVAPIPSLGGRVEQASRVALDTDRLARNRRDEPLGPLVLQAPGADHPQRLGGHVQEQVVTVEERPVVVVPFRQDPGREPGPAGVIGHRPADAAGADQPQASRLGGSYRPRTCPASVQDLAVPVDNRHAGLIGRKVGAAFPPGKVNTDEPSICHTEVVPRRVLDVAGDRGDRERRSPTAFGGA